jgi:hypothetical protein
VSEDAGIEPRTVASLTLAAYLLSSKYKCHATTRLDLIHNSARSTSHFSLEKRKNEKSRRKGI